MTKLCCPICGKDPKIVYDPYEALYVARGSSKSFYVRCKRCKQLFPVWAFRIIDDEYDKGFYDWVKILRESEQNVS